MTPPVIQISGISKDYHGLRPLRIEALTVAQGEQIAILGLDLAMAEHSLTGDYYRRVAAARKPVFSIGTLAMAVTMTAAILGASVDTHVLPAVVHAMIAYGAILSNVYAIKIEIDALTLSRQVVDEVNHLLGA